MGTGTRVSDKIQGKSIMIYWNGCSFVQGMEVEEPKNHFPYLVGSHFKQETWRNSKVGGSNDRISVSYTHLTLPTTPYV